MAALEIVQIPASDMDNFAYLIYCPHTRKGAVVDPSMHPERVLAEAAKRNIDIIWLLNTHGHQDHVRGNSLILQQTSARHGAHPDDVADAQTALVEGLKIDLGYGALTVMHTPGHSPGSVVFVTEGAVISGDTLFVSRCGRADLPGSDVEQLYLSLQRLASLPPETRIYPGHDYGPTPTSTLAWELQNNPYLTCAGLDQFIALRMG